MYKIFPLSFLIISFLLNPSFAIDVIKTNIKINKFVNLSSYSGNWDLEHGIKGMLEDKMHKDCFILESENPEYYIEGVINTFEVGSKGLASYGVGGYEEYFTNIKLRIKIFNSADKMLKEFESSEKLSSTNVGFSLLGGPIGNSSYQENLNRLWNLDFYSNDFKKSIAGQSISNCLDDAVPQISYITRNVPYGLKGIILERRGKTVTLSAGRKNNISNGLIFTVYSKETLIKHPKTKKTMKAIPSIKVGKIIVNEILDEDFSTAEITEGSDTIKKDDYIVVE